MKKQKPTILCNNCRNAWHGQSECPPRKLSDAQVLNVIRNTRQELSIARTGLESAFAMLVEAGDFLPAYSNRITEISNLIQDLCRDLALARNELESTRDLATSTESHA